MGSFYFEGNIFFYLLKRVKIIKNLYTFSINLGILRSNSFNQTVENPFWNLGIPRSEALGSGDIFKKGGRYTPRKNDPTKSTIKTRRNEHFSRPFNRTAVTVNAFVMAWPLTGIRTEG